MIHYKPVAISDRDGRGHAFSVEVGGGELRHNVRVLAPDGSIVGEVTTDGTVYWDPPPWIGSKIAAASVRQALATNGRLKAAVDERGVVLCLRAEPPRRSYSAPDDALEHRIGPDDELEIEYSHHPGRIISVK